MDHLNCKKLDKILRIFRPLMQIWRMLSKAAFVRVKKILPMNPNIMMMCFDFC